MRGDAISGGSWPGAFSALIGRNRRRYGGYIVHAAIVLLAIGIAGSSAYDTVNERRLVPGDTLAVGDYRLTYRGLQEREAANATEIRAVLGVERDGKALGTVEAGKNAYTAERQVSNEVGIRSDLLTGEDLFVIAEQVNADGSVYVRAFVKPLVNLIWLAGLVFVLGAMITLWPDAREQRRLALALRGRRGTGANVSAALVLGALLAAACVVLVALPYLREPQAERDVLDEPSELDRRRLELAETRDRALAALKELELDHRTGKVSDEDYRALVGPLRREAAEALRALEPRAGAQERVRVERPG